MKVIALEGNKKLSMIDMEKPKAEGKKLVMKVSRAGICGSDLHYWEAGDHFKGLVLGHEFVGVIEDPGDFAEYFKVGDRVAAIPGDPCGKCEYCIQGKYNICVDALKGPGIGAPGGFAEYVAVRGDLVRKIPDTLSDDEAAMLEPLAFTLRAITNSKMKVGDKVLIAGGGVIGQLCAMWARFNGASYVAITEVNKHRLQAGKDSKYVDEVFNGGDEELVSKLVEASNGGFDIFVDCVGIAPVINTGIESLKNGAMTVFVGINLEPVPINTLKIIEKELNMTSAIGYRDEFDRSLELLGKGAVDVKPFISKNIALKEVPEMFEKLTSRDTEFIKVLIGF